MSRINTNVSSLVAQTRLSRSNGQLQEALTRLSTGLRINSGKDDPAGLIASEALRSDITATSKAITNSERANQFIATADSALGQISGLLNDIRGLVTEAANGGVLSEDQIAANQLQVDSSLEAIDRISQVTTFQGRKLLDGSLDFITNVSAGATSISDLSIQQANLGTTGSLSVSVDVTTAATQAQITNNSINYTAGATGAGSIALSHITTPAVQATGAATLTGGNITISAVAGGALDGLAGNGIDVVFQNSAGAANSTGSVSLTNTVGSIQFDAVEDGTAYDDADIVFQTGGTTGAAYNSGTNTITVTVAAGTTVSQIATAVSTDLSGVFSATVLTGGANVYNAADNQTFSNVTDNGANGAATSASYASGTLTVNVQVGATHQAIANAINTGVTSLNAVVASGTGGVTHDQGDNGTQNNVTSTGADAVTVDRTIDITSNRTGTSHNGTVTFATSSSITAGTVDVQLNGSNITVTTNDNDTLTYNQLVSGIQSGLDAAGGDYTVALGAGAGPGTTNFVTATDTATETNVAGGTNDTGTGLAADAVFRLTGSQGSEVFTFNAGTTLASVVNAINLVEDATGVTASINAGALQLQSSEYGSSHFVDVDVISEGTGGTFDSSLSTHRDSGSDIAATVNGVQAQGRGNTLSINTATLDLSLTVTNGSSTDVAFDITGGGAVFQLGPDVVTNQQARIGIGSVNTGELGGTSGRLYELRSGNSKSLANDPTGAANVVDEVITKVNSLRGRLGAFQRTTLETNINSLNNTLSNLTEAESSIRDADFAAESAKLTRAQILVQSGTAVLQIANQNPQNVLSLLRG